MKLVLPGEPVAQQRCRIFRRGNRVCSFDPQVMYKNALKNKVKDLVDDYMWDKEGEYKMPSYPKISFLFLMPIPKSMSKKEKVLAESEKLKHIKKPDVDNLIKLYLDVLSGIVIEDDNCVSIGYAVKVYSQLPKTIILVEESNNLLEAI